MKTIRGYAYAIGILSTATVGMSYLTFLPWWAFLVSAMIFGAVFPFQNWRLSSFRIGFVTGFLVWGVCFFAFHIHFGTTVLDKIAALADTNGIVVILTSAVIGGVLSGLAVYSGRRCRSKLII